MYSTFNPRWMKSSRSFLPNAGSGQCPFFTLTLPSKGCPMEIRSSGAFVGDPDRKALHW